MKHTLSIVMVSVALLAGCAVNPVTGKKDFMLLSEQKEIAMGKESDPLIVKSFGLYEDDKIASLITLKGKEMAAISHRPHLKYEFKVLDSPVVNAFALPGGYVYFTRGILAHFNNEAEFAGVLGHEIGHITARHSAKQYSGQLLFQAGFIAGLIISPEFAAFSDLTQQALGMMFLKFSRDNESESDRLGVEYSTKVGYDAHDMANFFNTLDRMQGEDGVVPTFLSTHPNPADRFENVHALADEWQAKVNVASLKTNREEYLNLIDGLVYGEDPRQGFVEDDMFYHPNGKYKFPVPHGWEVAIAPSRILMAPESGDALIAFGPTEEDNLRSAATVTKDELNLTVSDEFETVINGYPAVKLVAVQNNPQNPLASFPFIIYFFKDGDTVYRLLGVSTREARDSYVRSFEKVGTKFSRLKDSKKLSIKPDRVKIAIAPLAGTVNENFERLGVDSEKFEEFALLNGMMGEDQIESGMHLKVIEK